MAFEIQLIIQSIIRDTEERILSHDFAKLHCPVVPTVQDMNSIPLPTEYDLPVSSL